MTSKTAPGADKPAYIESYLSELSPVDLQFALLSAGVRYEVPKKFRYLELGMGQGLSLNVHAAACPGEYWGNDHTPSHAENAATLAAKSGVDLHVLATSFEELAKRQDLPQFDIIAAHGIWTWVNDRDRAAIVEIVKRHLAPGGLFYVSYNSTAGWSDIIYLRELMNLYLSKGTSDALPIGDRISAALNFAQSLLDADANYFRMNPTAAQRLQMMHGRDRTYLQHEFFMDDWRLAPFADVASDLSDAGLEFAAPCALVTHDDGLALGAAGARALSSIADPILRETARECMTGWGFRQDIFIKGAVGRLTDDERRERLRSQRFVASISAFPPGMKARSPRGDVDLTASGCQEVLDAFASNRYQPMTFAELEAALPAMPFADLLRRLQVLTSVFLTRPAQEALSTAQAQSGCDNLNAYLLSRAALEDEFLVLASPVLGAGIWIARNDKMFCIAMSEGAKSADEMTNLIWERLEPNRRTFTKDQLGDIAKVFLSQRLPTLEAQGFHFNRGAV